MSSRELRRHAGRFVIAGFAGHTVPDDLRRLIDAFDLAGVIYFARNVVSPVQVAELSREAQGLAREWPLWISVDQEGGRVARLKAPFTVWPPPASLGRSAQESLATRYATALATELRAVGINLDFAPVLDILTNPANPAIGDRALSHDPAVVARLGVAVIRGLQDAGVAACGKHFPGHGDTSVDSHLALPVVEHDRRRLEAVEWVPFRAAIAADVASLMTAHLMVPALDANRRATFSPRVVTGELKQGLGFQGVVFSDDMGMKAATGDLGLPEASVAAIQAGCDAVLLCNSTVDEQWAAIEALIRAGERGDIPPTRVDDAFARQRRMKERFAASMTAAASTTAPAPPLNRVGCEAHQLVAQEMATWA